MDEQDGVEEVRLSFSFVFIVLLFLLFSCQSSPYVVFENENAKFGIALAKTEAEHQKGLMFVKSMPENKGMLFVFEGTKPRTFWMKNTLIPLDMIFLDENFFVVEVKQNILPCKEDPCEIYQSAPAKYVLEINAGVSEKKNIIVGSKAFLRE